MNEQKLATVKNMIPQNLAAIGVGVLRDIIKIARDAEVKTINSHRERTLTGYINNNNIDLSLEEWGKYIVENYPEEDLNNIFYSHDYIDTTGLHDLLNFITLQTDRLPQSTSFFKLPKESISHIFSYVKTFYEEYMFLMKSVMEKQLSNYLLDSMPFLKQLF